MGEEFAQGDEAMKHTLSARARAGLTIAALLILIALQLAVITHFAGEKDGFDIDELWTHGLANSYGAPFVPYKTGEWMDGSVFTGYLTVGSHAHEYLNVYENQIADVHPPLYYLFMHAICSVTKVFSKWNGIALNMACFAAAQLALFALSCRVLRGKKRGWETVSPAALGPVAAYGFGASAASTVIFIRMYAMMTMWAVLLALVLVLLWQEGHRGALLFALKAVLIFGFLTQYYFVIFACMLCAAYFLACLFEKRWKQAGGFVLSCLLALALAVGLFPWCLEHIFGGYRGKGAMEQAAAITLGDLTRWANLLVSAMNREQFAGLFALLLAAGALLLSTGLLRKGETDRFAARVSIAGLVACMAYLTVIAVVSPYKVDRYIFCIYPLVVGALFAVLVCGLRSVGIRQGLALALTACVLLGADVHTLRSGQVNYLFRGRSEYARISREHGSLPCVLLGSNDIEENLLELGAYERVYILGIDAAEQVAPALESHGGYDPAQGFVLYQRYGDEAAVEQVVRLTGAQQAHKLYSHQFEVYLIR